MTKKEMIQRIAQLTGLHQAQVRAVLDEFTQLVAEGMRQGDKVALRGFGTFFSQERAARRIRHPATRVILELPSRRRAAFRASEKMHLWVNLEPEQLPEKVEIEPMDPDQLGLFGD